MMYITCAIIHPCQTRYVQPRARWLQAGRTQVAWELVAGRTKLEGVASAPQTDCQQGMEASQNRLELARRLGAAGDVYLHHMVQIIHRNVIFCGQFVHYIICCCSFCWANVIYRTVF